ncbi:hypothetical protein HNO86_16955 [Pseudomonas sp. C1C7]|uniref:hypothetical protein n=1 Tax=Pseudomonas sp. C1C7 TaxID=2735272 RepID=UPI00158673AF|nr:hypothetical protein [Pseudomonas sp. C1C7]NUT76736.1 hypothetical protein [Pseudomonas sp. C1C7]
MAVSLKQVKAQQTRDDYRALRAKRAREQPRQVMADLAPPDLTGSMADPADGTLKGPMLKGGLSAKLVWWDNLPDVDGDEETVKLYWAKGHDPDDSSLPYKEVDSETYTVPNYPALPRDMKVPADELLPDGRYTLKYSVMDYKGDVFWSTPVQVICDQTAPRGPTQPEPDAMTFPNTVITDANVDSVVGTIPPYVVHNDADTVIYGWERVLPPTPEDLPYKGPVPVPPLQTVTFDADHIKAVGDGNCFVSYALFDKALNRSSFAAYARVHVALGALPANLHLPEVPLSEDGLDIEDAIAGIWVLIALYDNWKPRDEIEVTWGDTVLEAFPVGPTPGAELKFPMPAATLQKEYGDATGDKKTNVSYRVLRGGAPFGGVQAIQVDVNFEFKVGPPRPLPDIDWPNPVNPDLDQGTVTSFSKEVNKLVPADEGKDAEFTFKLYGPVNDGETIKFYWAGIHMPEADKTVDGESEGEEITVTVLWKYILQANNDPNLKMYYRIGSPDSPNEQQSPDRSVNANAVVLRPEAAKFNKVNGAGWLTCPSLEGPDHAIVVNVPDLSQWLEPGDTVNMKWWALPGRTGDPAPIPGTTLDAPITLTDDNGAFPVTGFQWRVAPPQTYVLPTYVDENDKDGRGRVTYNFTLNGVSVTSNVLQANVGMHEATQPGTCPLPPPRAK